MWMHVRTLLYYSQEQHHTYGQFGQMKQYVNCIYLSGSWWRELCLVDTNSPRGGVVTGGVDRTCGRVRGLTQPYDATHV